MIFRAFSCFDTASAMCGTGLSGKAMSTMDAILAFNPGARERAAS